MRNGAIMLSAILASAAGGCNIIAWPLAVFAPPAPTKTVQAEFDGLRGKSVAVAVYASADTRFEYETAQVELAEAIAVELRKNVKVSTVIDCRKVALYQDENPRWDAMAPERLCQVFTCDYVLLVTLQEFSTREPGLGHLARGRVTAQAALYRPPTTTMPAGIGGTPVWRGQPVRLVFPPDSPVGIPVGDEWLIRDRLEKMLADALVKKFYKHSVPVES